MTVMERDLRIGAPVYFVVEEGLDYTNRSQQNLICAAAGCDPDSLLEQINLASRGAAWTKIAKPATSWLDDYMVWLKPKLAQGCCQVFKNDTDQFCPSSYGGREKLCAACNVSGYVDSRPMEADFRKYINFFLGDNPGEKCIKG